MKCIRKRDTTRTWNIQRIVSRFPCYISCYIAESRFPLGHFSNIWFDDLKNLKTVLLWSVLSPHSSSLPNFSWHCLSKTRSRFQSFCFLSILNGGNTPDGWCWVGGSFSHCKKGENKKSDFPDLNKKYTKKKLLENFRKNSWQCNTYRKIDSKLDF